MGFGLRMVVAFFTQSGAFEQTKMAISGWAQHDSKPEALKGRRCGRFQLGLSLWALVVMIAKNGPSMLAIGDSVGKNRAPRSICAPAVDNPAAQNDPNRTYRLSGISEANEVGDIGVINSSTCRPGQQIKPPKHIVVVIEENRAYFQIIGNPNAPYINSLTTSGMLFTNYHAISHPSQPNYFALFSGSTQGVDGDGEFFFPNAPTIAGELRRAGYSFVGYAEAPVDPRHTPWVSFADSEGAGQPFSRFPTNYDALATVAFVIPNLLNDMHDGTIAQGDQWLKANLGAYTDWAMSHNSLLVVTFDEDRGTVDNRVPTVVVGPGVVASRSTQRADHYALLHTIELLYNLPPLGMSGTSRMMHFAGQGCE
jgi:hypothetical protein